MWKEKIQPYVESGDLQVVGVVQEQHPDRARLYRQWKQLGFPILVDSLNLLNSRVVPIPVGLDENGIVRATNMKPGELDKFMKTDFPDRDVEESFNTVTGPDPEALREAATNSDKAEDWRALGDALFLTRDGPEDLTRSIEAYRKALEKDGKDARSYFRLGVVLRRRYENGNGTSDDAQRAVQNWQKALSLKPNQYIWRRRLQQYGPRLDKPYNFYFWVEKAREEIKARGEKPVELSVEPRGSEVEPPQEKERRKEAQEIPDPDPDGKINRDAEKLVQISSTSTPYRVKPGRRVRVRVKFKLSPETKPYWNNEANPLQISLDLPDGVELVQGDLTYPNRNEPETRETRFLEFELLVRDSVSKKTLKIPAYSLYYVCKDKQGVCLYLRQDFQIVFEVDPEAPELK